MPPCSDTGAFSWRPHQCCSRGPMLWHLLDWVTTSKRRCHKDGAVRSRLSQIVTMTSAWTWARGIIYQDTRRWWESVWEWWPQTRKRAADTSWDGCNTGRRTTPGCPYGSSEPPSTAPVPREGWVQSTIYVSNGRAKTQIKGTVQIHFDQTMKHWVTSTCNESHVHLFDSLYFGRISDGIAKQLTVTWRQFKSWGFSNNREQSTAGSLLLRMLST